ncbi:MAG: phage tail protein, partial [Chitinophagaceae bacterium]
PVSEKDKSPFAKPDKQWMASNFKLEIDGLPCNYITKLDFPKITAKISEDKSGILKDKQMMPGKIEYSNLSFNISEADVKPWMNWYNNFEKQIDNNLKNGSIEYKEENNNPLFTISLNKIKPVSIQPAEGGSYTVTLKPGEIYFGYNPLPGFLFDINASTYVANEIAGDPCRPEGAKTISWLYIEKPCRVVLTKTRASNVDPDDEEVLGQIEDLLGEVSEDGADLGKKLSKTVSISKSFALWVSVVRDWESYKAEYICRDGVWQHGEMTLANSGTKTISGSQLFRGESGNDTWHEGDDMGWIMRQAQALIASVCAVAVR